MKRKGYIPTMALMITLTLGASIANAGILVSDRQGILVSDRQAACQESTLTGKIGDLIGGIATFVKTGILVSDRTAVCRNGILVSD